uniref:Nuclear pore complex protein Nup155 n=1 Tax=Phallusia mammillata TaxID=59560 RepID=A0A6F9DNM7_9ASCI|nr:nuclear pore complex protein Nup155 [Phallusia mammillata]
MVVMQLCIATNKNCLLRMDGTGGPNCANISDAAALVRKNLQQDRETIDLATQLNITSIYSSVSSGFSKDDYPTTDAANFPVITNVRRVPLPPELVEQFSHMQCNCIIGVFPQIGRAWLTVDSDIFVWRYIDGEDLAYFDGLSETILSVALVEPKPGIFREHIKYLLVLTTALDVVLLGVSFADDDINAEMHLLPDPLFTISSDGTYLLHTVGTNNGRIFCGGKDGCLYEIVYHAGGGWFSRKCTKINHSRSRFSFLLPSVVNVWLSEEDSLCQLSIDDTRNILYTRSEKGSITVYDLGADGQGLVCVAHTRLDAIQRRAREIASTIAPSNLNEIIHIAPITLRESRHLHLVAVTQAGVRLYFMTCNINMLASNVNGKLTPPPRPTALYLVHVRLPPFFTSSSLQRPSSVHAAHHNAGTLLLASRSGEDGFIWCINNDMYAFEKSLKEVQGSFELNGQSWAIAEVPSPLSPLSIAAIPPGTNQSLPPDPPIHIIQHIQKPPEYVVITSQGVHMFNKLRPVDQLRHLLETTTDPESDIVESFFRVYKNGEALCCCIIIAMSAVPTERHIAERAVAVFLHHGGLPSQKPPTNIQGPSSIASPPGFPTLAPMSPIGGAFDRQQPQMSMMRTPGGLPVISTPMPGASTIQPPVNNQQPFQQSLQPMTTTQAATPVTESGVTELLYFSERQHGVYKVFSRIMRPLWEGKLVEDYVVSEGGKQRCFVISRLDEEVIGIVLENLISFRNFVTKYCNTQVPIRDHAHSSHDRTSRMYTQGYGRPEQNMSVQHEMQRRSLAEAVAAELASMQFMGELVNRTVQVLGLWRLLLHHQLHVIFDALEKSHQIVLKATTFNELVLNGENLCSALISTLVTKYIDDNNTVDALSGQLREVCPSLYSPDDAICSKASELLSAARQSHPSQRQDQLLEAAHLFQQIAHSVNLPVVVQQFQAVRFYTGAVDLCLRAALKRDEDNLALKLYHSPQANNDPEVDPEFRKAYLARAECYKCIIDMLDELMTAGQSQPQAPSVPTQPGPPKVTTSPTGVSSLSSPLQPEEAQQQAERCLQKALNSSDELLHVTIYEWMMQKKLTAQLLCVSSPYVESFLKRVAASQEENPSTIGAEGSDLLWQYYERSGQHSAAAEILANLAEKPGSDRPLSERIENLSRAKINARSVTSVTADSATGGQLLHELEEKLEVAEIQMQTLDQLKSLRENEAVTKLNSHLVDITTLYREFAEPYQLAECKLAIVHCAGLHDPALVEALWQNIVEHELSKPSSSGGGAQGEAAIVKLKLIDLGKRYVSTRRYFPIESLVAYLEKISCGRGWDVTWTYSCMLEIGVSLIELLEVYGKLHAQKLPCWAGYGNPHHLLCVFNELLNTFLVDAHRYASGQQRRHLLNRSLDAMALHLVELRSITSPNEQVRHLIALMRRTQAGLEAMQERTHT